MNKVFEYAMHAVNISMWRHVRAIFISILLLRNGWFGVKYAVTLYVTKLTVCSFLCVYGDKQIFNAFTLIVMSLLFHYEIIYNTEIDNEIFQELLQLRGCWNKVFCCTCIMIYWKFVTFLRIPDYHYINILNLYSFCPYLYHMTCNIADREHVGLIYLYIPVYILYMYIYISLQFALYNISSPLILCEYVKR